MTVKQNLVDRVVQYFDPVRARARLQSRVQLEAAGSWIGGSTNRRQTAAWIPTAGSANADNQGDLDMLRRRSRDLSRHNPLALGAINTAVTSVVGTGLVMRSRIDAEALGMNAKAAALWRRKTEREFRMWAESARACDAEGDLNFYQLQDLAFRSELESGDVFASLPFVEVPGFTYSLKVLIIEADRVANKDGVQDSEGLCGGVQRDKSGAVQAYHIMRRHPYGLLPRLKEWDVVPAYGARTGRRNVIHVFDKRRPGQSRGYPYLSPVIESLRMLGNYSDAELTAATVSAFFTVFVKTPTGQPIGFDGTGAGLSASSSPKSGDTVSMGAGAIVDLAQGEEIETANPGRPNTAFDPFVQAVLRQIGVALEIPFELLIKHFTSSYTAARGALLEAWRFFRKRREHLAEKFCQPIYEAWLEEAIALGRIEAPGFFEDPAIRAAYCGATWRGDSAGQIDPLKEANAAKVRLDEMLTTRDREVAEMSGEDWEDVVARRAWERDVMNELDLKPGAAAPAAPAAAAKVEPDTEEDDPADLEDPPETDDETQDAAP